VKIQKKLDKPAFIEFAKEQRKPSIDSGHVPGFDLGQAVRQFTIAFSAMATSAWMWTLVSCRKEMIAMLTPDDGDRGLRNGQVQQARVTRLLEMAVIGARRKDEQPGIRTLTGGTIEMADDLFDQAGAHRRRAA